MNDAFDALTPVALDFETYYDDSITLSKLNYTEYVHLAEPQVLSVIVEGQQTTVGGMDAIRELVDTLERTLGWRNILFVSHNVAFDAEVARRWFGIQAGGYACTLSMARHFFPGMDNTLDALQRRLLPEQGHKGSVLASMKGRYWERLDDRERRDYQAYCAQDTRLCQALFDRLWPDFGPLQARLIDHTTKLFLDPVLRLDAQKAEQAVADELKTQRDLLTKLDKSLPDMRSDEKFAAMLVELGYDIPTKWSNKKQTKVPAFAKTDTAFHDFYEAHPELQPLLDLKQQTNSNINLSRMQRLLKAADIHQGLVPILYIYAGASTGRFSGGNRLNMQNLPRGSILRECLQAPPGYSLLVADFAQIEARTLAWLSGQDSLLRAFAAGEDVYSQFASTIYGRKITKANIPERFMGKTCVLGLGYSMSANKLHGVLALTQFPQSHEFCQKAVDTYRTTYLRIPRCWKAFDESIPILAPGSRARRELQLARPSSFGTPLRKEDTALDTLGTEARSRLVVEEGRILLPSGRPLHYPDVRFDPIEERWVYAKNKPLHGALVVENLCQGISFDIMAEKMLAVHERYRVVMHTHDEIGVLVEDDRIEKAKAWMMETMTQPLPWCPSLPLAVECGSGKTYGDAK